VLNKGTTGTIFITSLVWGTGDWGLNPALDASTLPLGYRGDGRLKIKFSSVLYYSHVKVSNPGH